VGEIRRYQEGIGAEIRRGVKVITRNPTASTPSFNNGPNTKTVKITKKCTRTIISHRTKNRLRKF